MKDKTQYLEIKTVFDLKNAEDVRLLMELEKESLTKEQQDKILNILEEIKEEKNKTMFGKINM